MLPMRDHRADPMDELNDDGSFAYYEINVVVSGEMTGIMRFRETGLLSYALSAVGRSIEIQANP